MLKDKDFLGFKVVDASTQDKVIAPQSYEARVLISWDDPLLAKQNLMMKIKSSIWMRLKMLIWFFGDNDDGMNFFHFQKTEEF